MRSYLAMLLLTIIASPLLYISLPGALAADGDGLWETPVEPIYNKTLASPLVAIGDVNHDGYVDLAVGLSNGHLKVVNGKDGSVLRDVTIGDKPVIRLSRYLDLGGDGVDEVLALTLGGVLRCVDPVSGVIIWSAVANPSEDAYSVYPRDFNGDGVRDIVVATGTQVRKVSGKTGMVIESKVVEAYGVAVIRDVDGNGWPDLAVREGRRIRTLDPVTWRSKWFTPKFISGSKVLVPLRPGGRYVLALDSSETGFYYLLDSKTGRFRVFVRDSQPSSIVVVGDVTGDGVNDVMVSYQSRGENLLLYDMPEGGFVWGRALPSASKLAGVGDLTGDGVVDVAALNIHGVLLINPVTGTTIKSVELDNEGVLAVASAGSGSIAVAVIRGGGAVLIKLGVNVEDSTPPVIRSYSPREGEGVGSSVNLVIVASDPESGLMKAVITVDGKSVAVTFDYADTFRARVELGEGVHSWSAKVYNNLGLYTTVGPVRFAVDVTPPVIEWAKPESNQLVGVNVTFTVKASDEGSGVKRAYAHVKYGVIGEDWITLSKSGDLWVGSYTLNRSYSELPIYWQAVVFDGANLSASTSLMRLNVDWEAPSISKIYLWPETPIEDKPLKVYCSVSETGSGLDRVVVAYFGEHENGSQDMVLTESGNYYAQIGPLRGGRYTLIIYAYDKAGNVGESGAIKVVIHSIPNFRIEDLAAYLNNQNVSSVPAGTQVVLRVNIVAEGDYFPYGANVTLYIDGVKTRSWIILPKPGESRTLDYRWIVDKGRHFIRVTLTSQLDKNPEDNTMSIAVTGTTKAPRNPSGNYVLWYILGVAILAAVFAAIYFYTSRRSR